jgi:hypothetical protein
MNKDTLIQLFKSPYKRQSFIDNGLLPTFQGKVANLKIYDAQGIQAIELTASEQNYAVSAVKYGEFQTLDEIPRTVELYEIIVNNNKQIERSRVGLGALVKKHIISNNAVFVNFAYENSEKRSWRFSFIARDGVFQDGEMQIKDTNPKRYTYVFGEPEETYKTALDRFFVLGNELEITINKIKDAFGVEAMSKAFFDEYRDVHYAGFVDYLMRSNFKKSAFNGNDKDVRDFVKKLLGRIVFLYFLQKKGWLGAKDTSYKNGDKNFMTNFFKKAGANDVFYSNWLSKLFFDALNNERPNDDFTMPDGEVVKIPYLNGGLFEKEAEKYYFLTFPSDLFANLFEFFDQYNFTIFEDGPEEHTVAVDPEMLGHIFENLLEDNKDKGAFYTPKEIVHYMTQESLIEYLHTQISEADRTELANFVKNKENQLSKEYKQQIDQKLDTVKICDPAIGSGAFPMGLLQEIFGLKERIAYDLGYKVWSPATVKENIIQKSIYGVDIERGAVDIARLRFWLSLIVDEEMPKALPNLDYKIVVGNSLVSKFDDTVIEIDWDRKGSVGEADKLVQGVQNALKSISDKQKQFFESKSNKEKAKLKAEIRNLKLDVLFNQLSFNKASYLNKSQKVSDMGFGLKANDHKKNLEIDLQVAEINQTLAKLKRLKDNPDQAFNHFDWKLDFPEVLNPLVNDEIGFDIVIGNPPYVEHKKLKHIASILKPNYKVYTGSSDLSVYFFEKGFNLLNSKGTFAYINTNKFFNTGYGKALRRYLTNKTFRKLVNFEQVEVFEGVLVSSVVFIATNETPNKEILFDFVQFKKEKNWKDYFEEKILTRSKQMLQCDFDEKEWVFESGKAVEIKNRIETKGTKIKNIEGVEIKRGVTTGFDPAFIISNEKANELGFSDIIKPLFKGEDIKKYKIGLSSRYLINTHNGLVRKGIMPINVPRDYPLIYEHLLKYYDGNSEGAVIKPNGQVMCLLNRSDQGDNWFNLRSCAFLDQFDETKIIWPLTADKWGFTIDAEGHYLTSGGFFLVSNKTPLKYLLGIMNSSLMNYYFKFIGVMTAGGAYTLKKASIEILPIIETNHKTQALILNMVDSILFSKNSPKIITDSIPNTHISEAFEEVIDALVFELYFPDEFAVKGIEIEKYANEIFEPIEGMSEPEQIKAIQDAYQTLREKDNPLRNQIKLMKIELKELLLPILSV